MDKISHCPECGTLWHYMEIPEDRRHNYSPPYFYSRVVGLYSVERDALFAYRCPDCGATFRRDGSLCEEGEEL